MKSVTSFPKPVPRCQRSLPPPSHPLLLAWRSLRCKNLGLCLLQKGDLVHPVPAGLVVPIISLSSLAEQIGRRAQHGGLGAGCPDSFPQRWAPASASRWGALGAGEEGGEEGPGRGSGLQHSLNWDGRREGKAQGSVRGMDTCPSLFLFPNRLSQSYRLI